GLGTGRTARIARPSESRRSSRARLDSPRRDLEERAARRRGVVAHGHGAARRHRVRSEDGSDGGRIAEDARGHLSALRRRALRELPAGTSAHRGQRDCLRKRTQVVRVRTRRQSSIRFKLIALANDRNAPLDELSLNSWFSKSQRDYLWNLHMDT